MKKLLILSFIGITLFANCHFNQSLLALSSNEICIKAIVIAKNDSWLLPILTPVCARLKTKYGTLPLLFVLPTETSYAKRQLLSSLNAKEILVIHTKTSNQSVGNRFKKSPRLELPDSPLSASLTLAKHFWLHRTKVIVSSLIEGEVLLQAATLSALENAPLLVYERGLSVQDVKREIKEFEATETIIAGRVRNVPRNWKIQSIKEIKDRIITTLMRKTIRNVVVVGELGNPTTDERTSLLGPYYAFVRSSPLVYSPSFSGSKAEKLVEELVTSAELKPSTVTILGSYDEIGLIELTDRKLLGEFDVSVEPCASNGSAAQPYGVGRLFHVDLANTSLLFARIVSRHRFVGNKRPFAALLTNPKTEYGVMPLAETISRFTAKDLKNAGIKVKEFNGTAPDDALAFKTASKASLFVFQGHIVDLLFLGNQAYLSEDEEESEQQSEQQTLPPIEFSKGPLVVLQSCTSLDGVYGPTCFTQGATAVIGSSTSIHSSSGSAFAKALCDGIAYRNMRLGEVIKEARNYFLCLYHLKGARGHKEQAKVFRVAMSFRLLGDPEMLLDLGAKTPKKQPVQCKKMKDGTLCIAIPEKRFPRIKTNEYFMKPFPGSQTAGLVKRLKNKDYRRITSTYYFSVKAPKGYKRTNSARLHDGETDTRGIHLFEPLHNRLAVLYYPQKELKKSTYTLRFSPK